MPEFVILLLLAIPILVLLWYLHQSSILEESEIVNLAARRRLSAILAELNFISGIEMSVDREFKARMATKGSWYSVQIDAPRFPAIAAALVKGKKHEWIVVGLGNADTIQLFWTNKGPDGTQVSPSIPIAYMIEQALQNSLNTAIRLHNHPSGACSPSEQDIISANSVGLSFNNAGIRFYDVVAVAGDFRLYGLFAPEQDTPLSSFLSEIRNTNNVTRWQNYKLRRELRRDDVVASVLWRISGSNNLK